MRSSKRLALCAVLVAIGTTMSTPSERRFCRMVERALVSLLAFSVTISILSFPDASSLEMMVSRIWSREVWLIG